MKTSGKVYSSSWGEHEYVLKFMEIHWDISLSTRNVNLVELEGKSEDHQSP